MRARDIMSSPVVTVTPDMTVKYAANLLSAHGFTALPVLDDDGRLVGVVTEADLVRDRFPRDARYHPARHKRNPGEGLCAPTPSRRPGGRMPHSSARLSARLKPNRPGTEGGASVR